MVIIGYMEKRFIHNTMLKLLIVNKYSSIYWMILYVVYKIEDAD